MPITTIAIDIPGPALLSSLTENNTAGTRTQSSSPGPSTSSTPLDPFSSFSSRPSASSSNTPQPAAPSLFSSPQQQQQKQSNDPFASLSTLSKALPSPAAASSNQTPHVQQANDDDEWSFSSALPIEQAAPKPREHRTIVHSSSLKIDMVALRDLSPKSNAANAISMMFAFSNATAKPISELHFQLAVTKVRFLFPSFLAPNVREAFFFF